MFKTLITITLLFMLTYDGESFRLFRIINNRRCNNTDRFMSSLSAHEDVNCAEACLQTAGCDAFNYNKNTSSVSLNCELLMTSATDYEELSPNANWSLYSSHQLLVSGIQIHVLHLHVWIPTCTCSSFIVGQNSNTAWDMQATLYIQVDLAVKLLGMLLSSCNCSEVFAVVTTHCGSARFCADGIKLAFLVY